MSLVLYSYFRSSAAFRARIALNLKAIPYAIAPVNLLQGEQRGDDYVARNPQGLVPALQLPDGRVIAQSVAILEWLEETYPQPALLPADPVDRARVRGWCAAIACDIHPLNNLRVLRYLEDTLAVDETGRNTWYHHWLEQGFPALEQQVVAGPFCDGATPGLADVYLVPQVANALRYRFDMDRFPRLQAIYRHCMALAAFQDAAPDAQPDHPKRLAAARG